MLKEFLKSIYLYKYYLGLFLAKEIVDEETEVQQFNWRIPGTGKPGGLPSMGSHRVRHDWSDLAAVAVAAV